MPQIKFTDTAIAKLKVDAITWYSDPTAKGLQLCATPAGVRTWYVVKWDPASQKTRRVKLGQWATRGMHTAWAKDQVGRVVLDVKEGKVTTKAEKAVERAGIPTLRKAFDKEMGYRRTRPASLGGPIHDHTDKDYTRAFELYLEASWGEKKMDEIDTAAVQRMLDDLVNEKPFAAHKVNVVLGITFKRAERMINARLPGLGSVRGRGGNLRRAGGVTGVAIEDVGLWWSCELQPRTEETPDDRDQHALDRAAATA